MPRFARPLFAATMLTLATTAPAFGADTTTFGVTITILKACDVAAAAATNVAFGSVASTATNIDNAGSLTVRCTPLTPYQIGLNEGLNGADVDSRAMINGTDEVPYQLYRDAGRTTVWGETTGTDTYAGIGTGSNQVIPVYGRVPDANYPALTYSDTVTATITY